MTQEGVPAGEPKEPTRRSFLKGLVALGAAGIVPDISEAQEALPWPKELKDQVVRLEGIVGKLKEIKDRNLQKSVIQKELANLKFRIQYAKETAKAQTIEATMKGMETRDIEVLYERIERVENELEQLGSDPKEKFSGLGVEKLPPNSIKVSPSQISNQESLYLVTVLAALSEKGILKPGVTMLELNRGGDISDWNRRQEDDEQVVYAEFKSSPGEYSLIRSNEVPLSKISALYINPAAVEKYKRDSQIHR